MELNKRNFMMGAFASFVAVPYIIRNTGLIMPVHDRGVISSYSTGLYTIYDEGQMLWVKGHKNITIPRNEFRKLSPLQDGAILNTNNGIGHHSFWLLKGGEAERLLSL